MFNSIEMDMEGDVFGRIYEYFLAQFAMSEGRRGGEFFTPVSIVRLIVEIIEPYTGRILDPACGSGGMFVQSARFIEEHQGDPDAELSIYGQERVSQTARLCQMNLAVHGLEGDIRQGNTYYEDIHNSVGKFDFVMANPPFNVNRVDKERIEDDPRFPLGLPNVDNANYLWVQIFYSALNESGRAGFVMANSAADARHSEQAIREKLIQDDAVDVMVSVGSNFFYTVTLPCTLWFLDNGKPEGRKDKVLFLDARNVFRQIDRAHRDFTPEQIDFLAGIVRLYRGEDLNGYQFDPEGLNLTEPQIEMLEKAFANQEYQDVPGLCKVTDRDEIETQGWSLNPGRYVGVAERATDDFDLTERLKKLNGELGRLNTQANKLERKISKNLLEIIKE
jgi:type I restriction enzyme M protein